MFHQKADGMYVRFSAFPEKSFLQIHCFVRPNS